jgi:hypothetical protein
MIGAMNCLRLRYEKSDVFDDRGRRADAFNPRQAKQSVFGQPAALSYEADLLYRRGCEVGVGSGDPSQISSATVLTYRAAAAMAGCSSAALTCAIQHRSRTAATDKWEGRQQSIKASAFGLGYPKLGCNVAQLPLDQRHAGPKVGGINAGPYDHPKPTPAPSRNPMLRATNVHAQARFRPVRKSCMLDREAPYGLGIRQFRRRWVVLAI